MNALEGHPAGDGRLRTSVSRRGAHPQYVPAAGAAVAVEQSANDPLTTGGSRVAVRLHHERRYHRPCLRADYVSNDDA